MKNDELPITQMYLDLCNNVNVKCWAKRMNSIIDHLGFTNIRTNFDSGINCFRSLQTRLRDQFVQEWKASITSMSKLDQYCTYKTEFKFEPYLIYIFNEKLRKCLTQFRLSSHNLDIEVGRYNNTPRENRLCKLCSQNVVESEYHFLLCCSLYSSLRREYIGPCAWPNTRIFTTLMSTNYKKRLINLARYINEAMKSRKCALENLPVS